MTAAAASSLPSGHPPGPVRPILDVLHIGASPRRHLNEFFSLQFLQKKDHVLFIGPVGVGKTFLALTLGAAATRTSHSVLFRRTDLLLREVGQARADHSFEAVFRRYLAPDLLILDDFDLHRLTPQQSEDLYALIVERHRRSSFIVTSNRDVSE